LKTSSALLDQSLDLTAFVTRHLADYPHLHLPTTSVPSLTFYYTRLTAFYVGLFSWYPVHFFAHSFRTLFAPPAKVETLDEKACLNLFVKEVLLRVLKGLHLQLEEVIKFYEIWDVHRVVLKTIDQGYKYDKHLDGTIKQFRHILEARKK
jgi:hypothetical protein